MNIKKIMESHASHISSDYFKAEQRFDEILRTKLGSGTKVMPQSPMHFGAKKVVDRENVTMLSGATAEDIDRAFAGTRLNGLGKSFVQAEKKHGVNAWFLASIAALESGYGTSKIANDKNNLFGFCAYDDSPYASAKRFKNFEDGINHVAGYLSKEYLKRGGAHFKGLSVDSVGSSYATDPKWADSVSFIMNQLSEQKE